MKTAIIIGAGPGNGVEISKRFGKEGFQIVCAARTQDTLAAVVTELKEHGVEAVGVECDASRRTDIASLVEWTKEQYGQVDVLVYNASILHQSSVLDASAEQITKEFEIDVLGALDAAQLVAPDMVERKDGAILITGGGAGIHAIKSLPGLSIGKAGVRQLTHMLHDTLKENNVYVGTVTIAGEVKRGTALDPANVAEAFYTLYSNRTDVEKVLSAE
ncbi:MULTISPECIES: SDR family oxidoreductase [unclassified Exiguobacterium]|uniref:SDR family NAD(P)-dependent oxidoreductase n=1 Tax=unclassified Exiguobacterium TaxID=2644629 RepID=UPI000B58AD68|nr:MULTISPECIES: SDR family NAD(P)-dependent oxidoreductase [unclassified Exiguobacterium]ASI34225.1 short-chain dehydrogenase [Exiguobacterium sp. N4-1P]